MKLSPHNQSTQPPLSPEARSGYAPSVPRRTLATIAATTLLLAGNAFRRDADTTAFAQGQATTPAQLADSADSIVNTTASAWASHQAEDGRYIDPVVGVLPFGVPKTGQAQIEVGARTGNLDLIRSGVRGTLAEIQHPNNEGFNVGLEVAGMANGYGWNQANLADNPDWSGARQPIVDFLIARNGRGVSKDNPGLAKCFDDKNCWYNLKLAKAFANSEMKAAGIEQPSGAQIAAINSKRHLQTDAIMQQGANNTSNTGRYVGELSGYGKAGILSDPPYNPLAYNAFSAMITGHILERRGYTEAPAEQRQAFERMTKSIVGSMAPNGDINYIGRGQGQVWTLGTAADALAIAAKNTADPAWRGRYLRGAHLLLDRINSQYTPGSWGLPLVPRHLTDPKPDYKGIDSYAQWASYNGTALWGLSNAAKVLRQIPDTQQSSIPADVNGTFIEPHQTKFAATRKGGLWWAVHGSRTHSDTRYDFGIVNAQRKINDTWKPVQTYRPLTKQAAPGSLSMVFDEQRYTPASTSMSADGKGTVNIRGGWSTRPDGTPEIANNSAWQFRQIGNSAIRLGFVAPRKADYEFQVWYPIGSQTRKVGRALRVTEPDGDVVRYDLNTPIRVAKDQQKYHSAYNENMGSSTIKTSAEKGKNIRYTTTYTPR